RPIAATICFCGTNPVHFSFRFITFQDFSTAGKDAAGGGAARWRGTARPRGRFCPEAGVGASAGRRLRPVGDGQEPADKEVGTTPVRGFARASCLFGYPHPVPQPRTGR